MVVEQSYPTALRRSLRFRLETPRQYRTRGANVVVTRAEGFHDTKSAFSGLGRVGRPLGGFE